MTGLPGQDAFIRALRFSYSLQQACALPRQGLRSIAMSQVSHNTLLRGPGPLGTYDPHPAVALERRQQSAKQSQIAIVKSAAGLGIISYEDARAYLNG